MNGSAADDDRAFVRELMARYHDQATADATSREQMYLDIGILCGTVDRLLSQSPAAAISLKQIQDALVEAFYDPDPADPTPEVDYARVDWLRAIKDARAQLDRLKWDQSQRPGKQE